LIFSFFCTCAELAVVSRQKDKENKIRFLSDNIDNNSINIFLYCAKKKNIL
jgi:hypothetical protein